MKISNGVKILVISSKETWAAKRLKSEARKAKVVLSFVTANKIGEVRVKDFDVLYVRNPYVKSSPRYLLDVVKLAKAFKKAGKRVVDSNIASGKLAGGKWVDYQTLKKSRLPIPKTQILSKKTIPKAWPFILKWVYGFKGSNVFLISNQKQFNETYVRYPKGELLVEKFIKADFEYKVITVGYKSLPLVSRFNISNSGFKIDFKNHKAIKSHSVPKVVGTAEKAAKLLGRELAKVDILEAGGKLYILEVNRFPGLEWYEKLSKTNATKAFLEYLSHNKKPKLL